MSGIIATQLSQDNYRIYHFRMEFLRNMAALLLIAVAGVVFMVLAHTARFCEKLDGK